jgi:hypothetical protein
MEKSSLSLASSIRFREWLAQTVMYIRKSYSQKDVVLIVRLIYMYSLESNWGIGHVIPSNVP